MNNLSGQRWNAELITGAQGAEKLFVPFQGLAILLGIVAFSMRLASAPGLSDGAANPAVASAG